MKKSVVFVLLFCSTVLMSQAQQTADSVNTAMLEKPPALSAIKEVDLREDIFALASDSMRGRRAGTLNELKAAAWIAGKAREAGLEPAGANGSYFQFFNLRRSTVTQSSRISINNTPAELWKNMWLTAPVDVDLNAQVTWLDSAADSTKNLRGKVVAMNIKPPEPQPAAGMSLWSFRYTLSAVRQQGKMLKNRGAAAVVLVADSAAAPALPYLSLIFQRGKYALNKNDSSSAAEDSVPVIIAASSWRSALHEPSATFSAHLRANHFTYPSANVVAKAPGSDPDLRDEYVLFSAHHDHEGVGPIPVEGDSVWNGADDNASTSVALLAIGRAWVQAPGRRSALFVWHGAEERGLFGSRYFVRHPTVNREAITAVLNGDLIGRNAPDSAALLGAIPPHRNSRDLVNVAMGANEKFNQFKVDTSWDAASHPEHWYFRSDHLPYARFDVPAIFFTTLLQPDYHTPKDEASRIDIDKLAKMTEWMYETGWNISENTRRPALDSARQ